MDRQLLRQKVRQKISVIETIRCDDITIEHFHLTLPEIPGLVFVFLKSSKNFYPVA